jgi:hypothetical protein
MTMPSAGTSDSKTRRRERFWARLPAASLLVSLGCVVGSCGDVTAELIQRAPEETLECRQDADCPVDRHRCDIDVNRCVGCLVRADCGDGLTCNLVSNTCVQDCTVAGACSGARPFCDAATRLCRGCGSDAECTSTAPHCDVSSGRCNECATNDDCNGEEFLCNMSTGRCVECLTDGHCEEEEERCSLALGECGVPCSTVGACPSDDPVCDLAVGFCVECTEDEDCDLDESCRSSDCVDTAD